jgi:hypothetical protein
MEKFVLFYNDEKGVRQEEKSSSLKELEERVSPSMSYWQIYSVRDGKYRLVMQKAGLFD